MPETRKTMHTHAKDHHLKKKHCAHHATCDRDDFIQTCYSCGATLVRDTTDCGPGSPFIEVRPAAWAAFEHHRKEQKAENASGQRSSKP